MLLLSWCNASNAETNALWHIILVSRNQNTLALSCSLVRWSPKGVLQSWKRIYGIETTGQCLWNIWSSPTIPLFRHSITHWKLRQVNWRDTIRSKSEHLGIIVWFIGLYLYVHDELKTRNYKWPNCKGSVGMKRPDKRRIDLQDWWNG